MLRESRCLAVAFLVVALLAATAGSIHAADLSWLSALSPPDGSQDSGTPSFMATKPRISTKAMCTASCGPYTLTCNYTPPSTCSATDRNCPGEPGWVQCGTAPRIYCTPDCSPPPPECTEGQIQLWPTGNCCENGLTEKDKFQCIGGQWEYVGIVCKIPFCGGV